MCLYVRVCVCVCACATHVLGVVGNKRKTDDRPQYSMYTDRVTNVCLQSSITGKATNYILQPLTDQYFLNDTA